MKIKCLHGYFQFREEHAGEVSDLMRLFPGFELVPVADYYTFSALENAPRYAISGSTYLSAPALVNYADEPWEVMRANSLVFDFTQGLVVPIATIIRRVTIFKGQKYFFSEGLILPGSITDGLTRVTDYSAWFSPTSTKVRYSEVSFA